MPAQHKTRPPKAPLRKISPKDRELDKLLRLASIRQKTARKKRISAA
jgi:hypothetical protein